MDHEQKKLEIRRNLFHLVFGIVLVVLIFYNVLGLEHLFFLLILGMTLSLVSLHWSVPVISWFLKKFERKGTFPGKGALMLVLGYILVLGLFQKETALAAMTILAVGDSISPLVGMHFGKTKHPLNNIKLLEGTIAGIVAGGLGASLFVPWWQALVSAFVALCVEALEIKFHKLMIDDNIIVPLIAGLTIIILQMI